jgi:hypothetical protein
MGKISERGSPQYRNIGGNLEMKNCLAMGVIFSFLSVHLLGQNAPAAGSTPTPAVWSPAQSIHLFVFPKTIRARISD